MAHALARRGGAPRDERHDWLAHGARVGGGVLLVTATNLTTDYDGVRRVVRLKEAQAIHERRADDRVAANTDAARLADARLREERHHFVGQCSGTRDEADAALAE